MASGSAQALRDRLAVAFHRRGKSWLQYRDDVCSGRGGVFTVLTNVPITHHICCFFTAIRINTSMVNLTLTTPRMASNGSSVGTARSTTTTTTTIANAPGNAGDFISTAPNWFWIAVVVCLLALALTVTNLYVLRRKGKLVTRAPEGKENLLADQS